MVELFLNQNIYMALCFQRRTAWVPVSLLFQASFILSLILSRTSIPEAKNIAATVSAIIDVKAEGCAIHTVEKPVIIGVPHNTFSEQFVNIHRSIKNPNEKIYGGFCIDVFKEAMKDSTTNYSFVEVNGTNDDLVNSVADGTLDGAIGDIMAFAYRSKDVKFTQPFTSLGMTMVVPMNLQAPNGLIFLTPLTKEVWLANLVILMYTMFIVWVMEHRTNPQFPRDQLGNILWFTFCSLFFSQGERSNRNYTRVVVVVWFCVVFFMVQGYAAGLSSILSVPPLPNVDSLKESNAIIGCFSNDIIRKYLMNVLHFKKENIRDDIIATQSAYVDALKSGRISAAFLQAPYAKAIVQQCGDRLMITGPTYELVGFGFVFQNVSPIAANVSVAILRLLEDGFINKLEDNYFRTSLDCSDFQTTRNNGSLSLQKFWVLYLFYAVISTICLLLFIKNEVQEGNITLTWASVRNKIRRLKHLLTNAVSRARASVWNKILGLIHFLKNAVSRDTAARAPRSDHVPNDTEMVQTLGYVV
ncbi:glutamate receptor 2.8-like [Cornus florida]|uniref:glutamate receptor 2.8-like n=1 Tax=Cornus florida TaxID=4283 RepID=UPI00289922AE|nr:glutamate receptor 2.8-like [Cornus florida]